MKMKVLLKKLKKLLLLKLKPNGLVKLKILTGLNLVLLQLLKMLLLQTGKSIEEVSLSTILLEKFYKIGSITILFSINGNS